MHTCAGLGCRVGVGGLQGGGLSAARVTAYAGLSIHLISGHSDEAPDVPIHARCLQQDMSAIGVVHGKCQGVAKGVVHMRLKHKAQESGQQDGRCQELQMRGPFIPID